MIPIPDPLAGLLKILYLLAMKSNGSSFCRAVTCLIAVIKEFGLNNAGTHVDFNR